MLASTSCVLILGYLPQAWSDQYQTCCNSQIIHTPQFKQFSSTKPAVTSIDVLQPENQVLCEYCTLVTPVKTLLILSLVYFHFNIIT